MKKKILIALGAVLLFSACQTYERLRSRPPACKSYNYSSFMGHTKEWVIAQNIPERWTFTGPNNPISENDPTRIAFALEGNPELVSGIGCN